MAMQSFVGPVDVFVVNQGAADAGCLAHTPDLGNGAIELDCEHRTSALIVAAGDDDTAPQYGRSGDVVQVVRKPRYVRDLLACVFGVEAGEAEPKGGEEC